LVDRRLLNIRLPNEFSRKTRSINDRAYYKANEYRTILFYLAFGIFKDILPNKYLLNLLKYILVMRILCQDKVCIDDCNDAFTIFDDFHSEFEKLYGKEEMTFNLHTHTHFPKQVMEFGQLNKRAAFCFENKFLHTRNLFHGTVNFDGQIAENLCRKQEIIVELRELKERSINIGIKNFIEQHLLGMDSRRCQNDILSLKRIEISTLKDWEINAFRRKIVLSNSTEISVGCSAIINFKSISLFLILLSRLSP